MSREEKCVLTNMCMIRDDDKVLVLERAKPDWPGLTFPGGHVEPGESFVDAVVREIREETGLLISNVQLCGLKQFPLKDGNGRYIVFCYQTEHFTGDLKHSSEGHVFWMTVDELKQGVLADGFDSMLEIFLNENLTENFWHVKGEEWIPENK